MPEQQAEVWLQLLVVSVFMASVLTWIVLGHRLQSGIPILRYEPRRPVPWGASGGILAVLMVSLALVSLVHSPPDQEPDSAESLLQAIAQPLALVLLVTGSIFAAVRAGKLDMGLPANGRELARDIKIGVVAWLAAIVPIYGLKIGAHLLWMKLWGLPEQHPLIETLLEKPDPMFLAAAFVTAVILAPLTEEISFRLLLQGWLEKVSRSARLPETSAEPETEELNIAPVEIEARPSAWPIVVSSLLFAVAHVGHGPDPIPLFFLALILGYVYRQTHRIVPCMVTHGLFNLLSLVMLVLLLQQQAAAPVP